MGKKNPNIEHPLLYMNKRSKNLFHIKKIDPNNFEILDMGRRTALTRSRLARFFSFYGVIDRFGIILRYEKVGKFWKKMGPVAAFKEKEFVTLVDSEKEIIKTLNRINRANPELSFYDPRKAYDGMKEARDFINRMEAQVPQENWEEV
jgi:hypothetical protein